MATGERKKKLPFAPRLWRYEVTEVDGEMVGRIEVGATVDGDDVLAVVVPLAGDLVAAALRLHHVALVQYAAGACNDDTFDTIEAQFQELLDMEAAVVGQITLGQWILARHGAELYRSDVARLRAAVRDLSAWAEKLAATAVPDPVE